MKSTNTIFVISLFLSVSLFSQEMKTVGTIEVPAGFSRIEYSTDSYPSFLRSIPLKANKEIRKWDGKLLRSDWILYDVFAVIDLPLLYNEDIEQCADFSMRLWSEYLKESNQLEKLSLFDYNGNPKSYSESGKSFEKYLRWHMAFSNSHSIKKGAKIVSSQDFRPGDMFVQNETGGIGHVSVVVDAAINENGDKVFLVGFGYMPAQEFHIEESEEKFGPAGWYTLEGYLDFLDGFQFSRYGEPILMRYE